jgi:IrrE N-terminal-like domain
MFTMTPRIDASRLAARLLLRRVWPKSESGDPRDFLHAAEAFAASDLKLKVEHVPAILGENQIAGVLYRSERRIQVATKFRLTSQRFTCAHEIGHFILHPGTVYFRDRELSAPGNNRDYIEIEADAFAAEFLMPRKFLDSVFRVMFGEPIDGQIPNQDLAFAVGISRETGRRWDPREFASLSPLLRATAVAIANNYKGRTFASLATQFKVSQMAMGIQLLQMGLVK